MKIETDEFVKLLGEQNVLYKRSDLLRFSVIDKLPQIALTPGTYEEVSEIVKHCNANKLSVIPFGSGTKSSLGNSPESYDIALSNYRSGRR